MLIILIPWKVKGKLWGKSSEQCFFYHGKINATCQISVIVQTLIKMTKQWWNLYLHLIKLQLYKALGSKGGAVVRVLASHHCCLASNSGVNHMWVECVVDSFLCSERFFTRCSGSPLLPYKPKFPNSNLTRNQIVKEPLSGCATFKSSFIYSLFTEVPSILALFGKGPWCCSFLL